jgi:hypothetical protein
LLPYLLSGIVEKKLFHFLPVQVMQNQSPKRNYYKKEETETPQSEPTPLIQMSFWKTFAQRDFRLDQALLFRAMPYFIYAAFLGLVYIANRHYTDRIVRKVITLRMEVEELRVDYITLKSDFISKNKEQEVAKKAKRIGLIENGGVKVKIEKNK